METDPPCTPSTVMLEKLKHPVPVQDAKSHVVSDYCSANSEQKHDLSPWGLAISSRFVPPTRIGLEE